jgi:hypothetical protein
MKRCLLAYDIFSLLRNGCHFSKYKGAAKK